jgi:hypothetical protein
MKNLILFLLLFAAGRAVAQNIAVSGTVGNEQGQPVRYAFIYDPQTKNAVFSDSTGTFSLTAGSTSQLVVNAKGYINANASVGGQASLKVTLKADPNAATAATKTDIDQSFKTSDGYVINSAVSDWGATNSDTRDVVGSRFLFKRWVPGYVIKANGDIVEDAKVLFNYDKIKGDLYYNDNGKVSVNDKNFMKGFVLESPQDQPVHFEMMTGISSDLYSIVLSSGPNYKLYKLIKTKYTPADYKTDGLSSTGNKYDEYADDITYYVMNMKTSAFQPLQLRKKSIQTAFAADGAKLNTFMSAHSSDKIDEDYLKALGDAMNQ